MTLKDTMNTMKKMVKELERDLEKASGGNKAAAQRVRTGSIKFAKFSKVFRKESVTAERGSKKPKAKKPAAKKIIHAKRATAKLPARKGR